MMRVFALIITIALWPDLVLATDAASLAYQQQADKDYREDSEYLSRENAIGGVSKDYDQAISYVFREAYASDVRIRVLSAPSFSRESILGIKENDGKYTVFWIEPKFQLWGYGLLELFKNRQIVGVRDGKSTNAEEISRLETELPELARCRRGVGRNWVWRSLRGVQPRIIRH